MFTSSFFEASICPMPSVKLNGLRSDSIPRSGSNLRGSSSAGSDRQIAPEFGDVAGGLDVVPRHGARVWLFDDDKHNARKVSTGAGWRRLKHPAQPSVPASCSATAMARLAIAPISRRRKIARSQPEPGMRGSKVPVQTSLVPPSTESR